ncbi:hypothetical protein KW786_01880 [Candidatus Parcubacteria bacterium]|nr:hypothetical protein [Candidatus Parcubacteria bacterium]
MEIETQNNAGNPQDPLTRKNLKNRVLSWITASAGLIVILLLIGGGALLAGRVWDPLWNPLRPNPKKVIAGAFANIKRTNSLHLVSDIDIISGSQVLSGSLISDIDSHDFNSWKAEGKFDVTYSDALLQSSYAKSDVKLIGQDVYLKMVDYSPLVNAYASVLKIDIAKAKGQWMLLPGNQLVGISDLYIIKNAMIDRDVVVFKKNLPDEMVDGQKVYHYSVTLNTALLAGKLGQNFSAGLADALSQADIDLGIGSKDGNIQTISLSKDQVENFMKGSQGNKVDVKVKIHASEFNKPVTVQPPPSFIRWEEVLKK